MSAKTILLAVAEPRALVDIVEALGDGWAVTSVSHEADALAALERREFDALLVDFNLGSPNASELLNQAFEKRPETSRFLLAYEADLALIAAFVTGPHEILPKPIEPASLKSRIERGVAPEDSSRDQSKSDAGIVASAVPIVPAIYAEVLKALEQPGVSKSQVGKIIAADEALASEVLRLSKSAHAGFSSSINDPVQAVEAMGLEAVRALVMALRYLAEHSQLKPGYLSFEKVWQHSTQVAQIARDLILFETKNPVLASEAFAAGLLHDLGKVVLASNFADLYARVHSLARKQPVALWDVEKEMFGANHGEIGACLVGMWNMPNSIVQAVALHHEPPVGEDRELTPLAAIHVANVLEHQSQPTDEFRVAPVMSMPFLNERGLLHRLPVWRAVLANHRAARTGQQFTPGATSHPQSTVPELSPASPTAADQLLSLASTQTATLSEQGTPVNRPARQRLWVFACSAVALGILALWLGTQPRLEVRARTPEPIPTVERVVIPASPMPEPIAPVVTETAPAVAVSQQAPATNTVAAPEPVAALPSPTPATSSQVTVTNTEPPIAAIEQKPQPEFKLNGIIYSITRPAAIVNGRAVFVGDQISGATVQAIGRQSVSLQINGSITHLSLKADE